MIVKKRVIAKQPNGEPIFGFTIPKEFGIRFEKTTHFSVDISGLSISYSSGTNRSYTKEQIKAYQYEDCLV